MAFVKKTWKDRIVQYANRRLLTKSGGGVEQVTVTRDEGTIYEEGDKFNADNMNDLEQRISDVFDYDETASGSIVHITDGGDNIPVKSLVSQIVAVESGSGEKSPENPYTISGFDSGVITRCGKNLLVNRRTTTTLNGVTFTVNSDGSITLSGTASTSFQFNLNDSPLKSAKYTMSNGNTNLISGISLFAVTPSGNKDVNRIKGFVTFEDSVSIVALWITSGTNTNGVTIKPMIELGDTATTYEAYNGNTYTFTFGQTVFGGHFDNKGNAVVTKSKFVFSGSETWDYRSANGFFYTTINTWRDAKAIPTDIIANNGIKMRIVQGSQYANIIRVYVADNSDYIDSSTDMNTIMTNTTDFIYELLAPDTLSITSQDIPTFLGENIIFSNCGDLEVDYYTDNADDILNFIHGELSAKADKTEDTTITVASGITLISSSCGKTDRLVHLNFNVEKTGGFATGWQVIGTTEFKPNTLAYCPLWNVTNGVGNGEVRIDTDGTINFYVVTAGELRLNVNIGYITD